MSDVEEQPLHVPKPAVPVPDKKTAAKAAPEPLLSTPVGHKRKSKPKPKEPETDKPKKKRVRFVDQVRSALQKATAAASMRVDLSSEPDAAPAALPQQADAATQRDPPLQHPQQQQKQSTHVADSRAGGSTVCDAAEPTWPPQTSQTLVDLMTDVDVSSLPTAQTHPS